MDQSDPLFGLVTHQVRDAVAMAVGEERSYKIEGSVGRGNWAETPWVSVFDLNVTDSATRGYYLVYLFRRDGSGVYLSLNQGATAVHRAVGARYEAVLEAKARGYAGLIEPNELSGLELGRIDLGGGRPPLTPGYEAANVAARFYRRDELPPDETLGLHLRQLLGAYARLVATVNDVGVGPEDEDPLPQDPEQRQEARRLRWHLRAEGRNRKAVEEAKQYHGYRCMACSRDFESELGRIGRRCIEAHHKVPFQSLDERPVQINPITDYDVVCSNCHRLLHSSTPPLDVEELRELLERDAEAVGEH